MTVFRGQDRLMIAFSSVWTCSLCYMRMRGALICRRRRQKSKAKEMTMSKELPMESRLTGGEDVETWAPDYYGRIYRH